MKESKDKPKGLASVARPLPDDAYADAWHNLLIHRELIFCICLGYCKNFQDAEDMTQETFLKVLKKIDSLNHVENYKLWLCGIARHTCLDHLRKLRIRSLFPLFWPQLPDTGQNPEASLVRQEQTLIIKQAVKQLPKKQRDIFVLREYAELSYHEIATILGLKEGTVMSTLQRARLKVQDLVKEMTYGKEYF